MTTLLLLTALVLVSCTESTPRPKRNFAVLGKHITVRGKLKPGATVPVADAQQSVETEVDWLESQPGAAGAEAK